MDGANDLQVLWSICPAALCTILLTIGMFYAVYFWNEFFTPILYLNDAKLQPLPVLLGTFSHPRVSASMSSTMPIARHRSIR